jgi:hypothetical protein
MGPAIAHSLEVSARWRVLVQSSRPAVLDEVADVVTGMVGIEIVRIGTAGSVFVCDGIFLHLPGDVSPVACGDDRD